jgi:hypothetical protein
MTNVTPTILSTVSSQFVDDWLAALRALCPEAQMASLLSRSGLNAEYCACTVTYYVVRWVSKY